MIVYGLESVQSILAFDGYLFKLIANDSGVILFPYTIEHRDAGQDGVKYADDSAGNALAAMVKFGRIEFRFHRDFSDERVRAIAKQMVRLPEMAFASEFTVTYQGRTLIPGREE